MQTSYTVTILYVYIYIYYIIYRFIDASYDGDIMVAAGNVDFTAGREATTTYNESLAGARVPGWVGVGGPQHVPALKDDGSILK